MSDSGCDVLLTGSMGNIADVARKALESHGLTVRCMPFAQNTLRDECGYLRELKKSMSQYNPHVIIPVGDATVLSRFNANSVLSDAVIPVDTPNNIELLNSKTECYRLAAKAGLPQPRLFADIGHIDMYPVIFKRDRSFGGTGVRKPSTRRALEQLIAKEKPDAKWLVQEYIDGQCCSIDVFMCNGMFEYGCYRTLSTDQRLGPSVCREALAAGTKLVGQMSHYAEILLGRIGFQGVCGLDFIMDNAGQAYFLECNPRFTGGLQTQLDAGLDLPFLWYNMAVTIKKDRSR